VTVIDMVLSMGPYSCMSFKIFVLHMPFVDHYILCIMCSWYLCFTLRL